MSNITRAQRAETLFSRLANGPAFSHFLVDGEFTTKKAIDQYQLWAETWIITEVCALVPELRNKLDSQSKYVKSETVAAAREQSRVVSLNRRPIGRVFAPPCPDCGGYSGRHAEDCPNRS